MVLVGTDDALFQSVLRRHRRDRTGCDPFEGGRKSERIGKVLFHGLVPMVSNICEPVADAKNLVVVGLSLDERNHVDIAVRRDGPSRA